MKTWATTAGYACSAHWRLIFASPCRAPMVAELCTFNRELNGWQVLAAVGQAPCAT
jgi:hypothetical protein